MRLLIFLQPLGRALKNQNAAPTTPPCFSRWLRSSSLLFESSRRTVNRSLLLDIPTGWEPRAKQSRTVALLTALCAAALFKSSYPLLQLKGNGHVKQKRQWTVCLPVDVPTGWEPRAKQSRTVALLTALCAAALFKSSYPLLQLKGNCRVKQKRQLLKAVFLVVRVVIQHFLKTIVVQFVFEVIG